MRKKFTDSLHDQQMSLFLDTLDHRDRLYNHFAWHCYKAAFRKGARTMMELLTKGGLFKSSLWNPSKRLVQAGRGGFPHTPPVFHTGPSITLSHGPRMRGGRRLA